MLNGNMQINGDTVAIVKRLKNNNGLLIQNSFADQYFEKYFFFLI